MKKLHGKVKFRRVSALFLSLVLVMGSMPIQALAEDSPEMESAIIETTEVDLNEPQEEPVIENEADQDDSNIENPSEEPDSNKGEDDEDQINQDDPDQDITDEDDPDEDQDDQDDADEEDLDQEDPGEEDIDEEEDEEEAEIEAFDINLALLKIDFSKISANRALLKSIIKDVEIDMNDPVLGQLAEELESTDLIADSKEDFGIMSRRPMILAEEDEQTGLTEEQKAEILGMFTMYLQHYADNANVLGVQLPFFLNENDNDEDGLGILGEMLVLAGNTVEEVRSGKLTYDEVSGMLLTFMLGDQLGVGLYGEKITGLRDDALATVENSSAKTEAQRLLVLNDWLAPQVTFNMSYIMNVGKGPEDNKPMQAENPQPHNNYYTVYGTVYNMLKESILEQLKDSVKEEFTYEMFIYSLVAEIGEEAVAGMPEEYKEELYEDAILEILASDDFTAQLGSPYEEFVENQAAGGAEQLTPAILNYWEGSIFGTLGEGGAVCLGYTRAYAYLVQAMHPEVYLKAGETNLDEAENWITYKDLYFGNSDTINIDSGYLVDAVRITFDANVTMYGETQENFNSDHFWNAVRVDGKWYYVDPTYNDAYVEVMIRDRVETDGNMSHLYMFLSDDTTRDLYEGYFSEIRTLYKEAANNKDYEDSWMVRAISNTFSDNQYFYYVYSSQDLITLLEESNNSNNMDSSMGDYEYKLVRHQATGTDAPNIGDTDFEALIDFNYKANDDETYARVNGVKDDYLTALYAEHEAMTQIYPSITISTVLYNNKLYFNLSNVILSYDLGSKTCSVVKEMGAISVTRDKTVAFGGVSFSFVEGKNESADFVFNNHPIAAIALDKDGNFKVSMATNLAYISGKDDGEYKDGTIRQGAYTEDRSGYYGYEFEETNFNPAYNTYTSDQYQGFVNEEINDNDEFMWVANAVNGYSFSELSSGTSTNGMEFVGVLCKDGEHAYIQHDEIYFTKDDSGQWNRGTAYVCVTCAHSIFEPTEPTDIMKQFDPEVEVRYEEQMAVYKAAETAHLKSYQYEGTQWAEDYTSVRFSTLNCKYSFEDYQLDGLYGMKPVEKIKVVNDITTNENDDGTTTYIADSRTVEDYSDYEYYASITVDKDGNIVEDEKYMVQIVDGGEGATMSARYEKGATVTITAGTKDGYSFQGWTSEEVTLENANQETTTFVMPGQDVTVTATWTKDDEGGGDDQDDEEYVVSIVDGVTGAAVSSDYKEGDTVTITAGTKEGYSFKEWTSKDVSITNANKETANFIMPDKNVTVTSNWMKNDSSEPGPGPSTGGGNGGGGSSSDTSTTPVAPEEVAITETQVPLAAPYKGYKDVLENAWYYEVIKEVTTSGLFAGISEDLFGPDVAVTRGMFVTILSRVEFGGSDKVPSGTSQFTDLSQDWYKDSIAWAAANGITYGTSDTKFSPEAPITREQMIVMLYRYAIYRGYDTSHSAGALDSFDDKNMVTKANETAMEWALKQGLISGMTPSRLAPREKTTRAQFASIMTRFIDYKG